MSKHKAAGLAALIILMLSACVGSDDDMARFLVAPGKFDLYTCPELMRQAVATGQHRRRLEQLMAKAGQEADGQFVSTMVYRPDYLSAQGELRDLRETAAAKRCDLGQLENVAGPDNVSATSVTSATLPALR